VFNVCPTHINLTLIIQKPLFVKYNFDFGFNNEVIIQLKISFYIRFMCTYAVFLFRVNYYVTRSGIRIKPGKMHPVRSV